MPAPTAAIRATGLTKRFGDVVALDGLDLVVPEGTVLGVLIFATLSNVFTLNNQDTSTQAVAKGLIIVVAVLLQQRLARRATST